MILTCPSCDARYKLDMAALRPEGQTVRCFKCKHTWTQNPPEAEDEGAAEDVGGDIGEDLGEDDGPIDLENFESRPVNRETGEPISTKPPSKIGKIVNWLLFFLIFGGIIGGAIVYRDVVRDIWPVSNRLYILVGLGVEAPGTGLELRNVTFKRSKKDGAPSLTISGEIANVSRKIREVPLFSGELTNSAGETLHGWTFAIRQKNLLPGESVPFKTEVDNLPKGAADPNITFLDPDPEPDPETMTEEDAEEEMSPEEMSPEDPPQE